MRPKLATIAALVVAFSMGIEAKANHPVLLDGNNATNAGPNATLTAPGTGGDYDGDGFVGTAEDTDNGNVASDRIFGTLNAALGPGNGGANRNGKVLILKSGRFPEQVVIDDSSPFTALNGVTLIEAAPGVQADIDAVNQGDPGNAARQAGNGITIDTDQTDRIVILRNLEIRNYQIGIDIKGNSRVIMEDCRLDSNVQFNVRVSEHATLTMVNCSVSAAGMRFPAPGALGGDPGAGIGVFDKARVVICDSNVSGNLGPGILKSNKARVELMEGNCIANNGGQFDDDD